MLEFLKDPFLVSQFSYYKLMIFLVMLSVILLSMLMILLCDQVSDLWQQLELSSELESDLRGPVVWGKKWLVNVIAGKAQLVSNTTGGIDVKMDGSVFEEKSSYKMLELTCSSLLLKLKMFSVEVILKFLRRSYLAFLPLMIQKIHLF